MGDPPAAPADRPAASPPPRASYRAELLRDVRVEAHGLLHRTAAGERLLRWEEVWFAVAAEIGEPEGVRAIVVDLVLGRDALGWRAARIDAEPGCFAEEIARAIQSGLPRGRRGPSIKTLAADGVASQWYPDLESFEEAVVGAIPPCNA
jgi:hypothetical protein